MISNKTDTSESPAAVGPDLSQKVGGIVLGGDMVNGDSVRKIERSVSGPVYWTTRDLMNCMSKFSVELKFRVVMDRLLIPRRTRYNKTTRDFYFAESLQSPANKEDKWEFLFVIVDIYRESE